MAEVEARVSSFIDREFIQKKKQGTYLLFTHQGPIRALLQRMDARQGYPYAGIEIGNASITRVTYTGSRWRVLSINDCEHLTRELF